MTPIDKDAVLDAFAAEPVHDRNTLERYVSEYPELTEELIDLAAELRLSTEFAGAEEGVINDPKLETAWENFLAAGPKPAVTTAVVDPFAQFKGGGVRNSCRKARCSAFTADGGAGPARCAIIRSKRLCSPLCGSDRHHGRSGQSISHTR